MNAPRKDLRIGELLVDNGVVSKDQIKIALTEQQKSQEHLGKILVRLGFATEAVVRDVLGGALGQRSVDLTHTMVDPEAARIIPKDMARRFGVLPLSYDSNNNRLTLAMSDIFNVVALDQLAAQIGNDIELQTVLAGESAIKEAVDRFYGHELSVDGILREIETGEIDYSSLEAENAEYSQPVVRLVNALMADAVKRGASDIHFEPEEGFLRFRYRIDGVLRQIRSLHKDYWAAISVRLKVMAGMDIAEMRAPQDGRISLSLDGRPIDFRVSTLPTVHGENIVLRILDRDKGIVELEELGLDEEVQDLLRMMVARPEGIILVTGPTGSGKTTTLYSILNHLNSERVNIMTLEDPVEYPMGMIRQTSVNDAVRLDFATGIRTMLRQDPDIILVGEIRDEATASMAFRAAMTGHQVFSTLHTNSAIGSIPRLLDIGVRPDIMADNIIGVMAQRLVRKLCTHCREPYDASEVERRLLGVKATTGHKKLYRATGCNYCDQQGYRGRTALMEVLKFDAELNELVSRGSTVRNLTRAAKAKGFKSLADVGIQRILKGETTIDEVSRVVDLTAQIN